MPDLTRFRCRPRPECLRGIETIILVLLTQDSLLLPTTLALRTPHHVPTTTHPMNTNAVPHAPLCNTRGSSQVVDAVLRDGRYNTTLPSPRHHEAESCTNLIPSAAGRNTDQLMLSGRERQPPPGNPASGSHTRPWTQPQRRMPPIPQKRAWAINRIGS